MNLTSLQSSTIDGGSTQQATLSTTGTASSHAQQSTTTEGQSSSEFTSFITGRFSSSVEETSQQTQTTQISSTTEPESTSRGQSTFTTDLTPMSMISLQSSTIEGGSTPEATLFTKSMTSSPEPPLPTTEGQRNSEFTSSAIWMSSSNVEQTSQQTQTTQKSSTTESKSKTTAESTFTTDLTPMSMISLQSSTIEGGSTQEATLFTKSMISSPERPLPTTEGQRTSEFTSCAIGMSSSNVEQTRQQSQPTQTPSTTESQATETAQLTHPTAVTPMSLTSLQSSTIEGSSTQQGTLSTTGIPSSPAQSSTATEAESNSEFTSSLTENFTSSVEQTSQQTQTTTISSTTKPDSTKTTQSTFTTIVTPVGMTSFQSSTVKGGSTQEATLFTTGTPPSFAPPLPTSEGQSTSEFTSSAIQMSSSNVEQTIQQSQTTQFPSTTESQATQTAQLTFTTAVTSLQSSTIEGGSTQQATLSTTGMASSPAQPSTTTEKQSSSEFTSSITGQFSSSVEETSQQIQTTQISSTTEPESTSRGQSTFTTAITPMNLTSLQSSTIDGGSTQQATLSTTGTASSPAQQSTTTEGQSSSEFTSFITGRFSSSGEQTSQQIQTTQISSTTEPESTSRGQSTFTTDLTPMSMISLQSSTIEGGSTPEATLFTKSMTSSPEPPLPTTEGQRNSEFTSSAIWMSSSNVEQTSQQSQTTQILSTTELQATETAQLTHPTAVTPMSLTSLQSSTIEGSSTQEPTLFTTGMPSSPTQPSTTTEGQSKSEFTSSITGNFTSSVEQTSQQTQTTQKSSTTESKSKTTAESTFTKDVTPISMISLQPSTVEGGSTQEATFSTSGTSSSPAQPSTSTEEQNATLSKTGITLSPGPPSPTTEGQTISEFTSSKTGMFFSSVEQTSLQTNNTQLTFTAESMSMKPFQSSTSESGLTLKPILSTTGTTSRSTITEGQSISKFTSSIIGMSSSSVEQTSQQRQTIISTSVTELHSTPSINSTFPQLESTGTISSDSPTSPTNPNSQQTITQFFTAQTFNISTSFQSSASAPTSTQKTSSKSTESHTVATTQNCLDNCQCNGSPCIFNVTSGKCRCKCSPFTFGDSCNFANDSSTVTWSESTPTRNASISLRIIMDYLTEYENLISPESKKLISIIKRELSILCKRADTQNFKDVHIRRLTQGSVIAESIAVYNYPNNNSQIMFLNNDLEPTLEKIFNDSDSFKNLSIALGNVFIQDARITMEPVTISNITDLRPFVQCTVNFANITPEIEDNEWVCVGPCKKYPKFCNQQGECRNAINGPQCRCNSSAFEEYYGAQCELYSRGAGFYAVLFGCLAAFALLIIVLAAMIVVLYRAKKRTSSKRRLSFFDDDFFDFTSRGSTDRGCGHQNFSVTEDSESGSFSSYNEKKPVR
ncbi:mucin-3A-like isoform X2 [Puntigrus tetrazona]|uniref:mucin-3A-like isoform X2 n=1 Tax=Puntigrus tetrazona TaxID=1606681 RepID=UPI001C89F4F7|nr:mucin-3A-like isoform X2 [Puntigrus tetrazona]